MKQLSCDVAIIGAGSAGLAARRAAAKAGARTLLIEAGPGGTTCARVGCMPSKLLLAAARAARDMRDAPRFGVGRRAEIWVDGPKVMARVRRERDHFVAAVLKDVAAIPAREKLAGHARFDGPGSLVVDDHSRIDSRAIVIATGARPRVPASLSEACGERVLTHETVFDLPTLPGSLAVIGAGPLGLELAIAFARLGVRVTLFDEGETIGAIADPVVHEAARAVLGRELAMRLGVEVQARRIGDGQVRVSWRKGQGRPTSASFDYVLSAAGRPPSLDGLDLNMSGLATDDRGVPEFDLATMRCGDGAVFIAGDADAARPVLHEAASQGELAGSNAARYPRIERRPPATNLAVAYTDPDIAMVGAGYDPEKAKGWAIGCSADNGRARVDGRDPGVLRVYARKQDGVIVGGELFGPAVEHLAQMLTWIAQLEMTAEKALALPFYHPTMEESLRAALRDLASQPS
ncbi:MAG TPA: dihydrolipoyl dehydrogenase [Caulobacteraceae bacterium]|nr:dihydrolipoyl dehydrogenase [Caulobacteraceae bacterium]